MHPFCYVELIPTSLEFSVFYCFTEAGQALAFERFIIQCLNLIKTILLSTYYRPAKIIEGIEAAYFLFVFVMYFILTTILSLSKQRRKIHWF